MSVVKVLRLGSLRSFLLLAIVGTALGFLAGCGGVNHSNQPTLSVSSSSLSFSSSPAVTVTQTLTLSNTGESTLDLQSVTLSGAYPAYYSVTNNCGTTLTAGSSCTLTVGFTPVATGSFAATLSIASNSSTGSTTVITLNGTSEAATLSLSNSSLAFSALVGSSAQQSATLNNTGNGTLSLASLALSGTDSALFSITTNGCGSTLAAGASCAVTITFTPTAVGTFNATLSIASNSSAGSPVTVALTGTSTTPTLSLSDSSFSFSAAAGATSQKTLTLSNIGTSTLNISSLALSASSSSLFTVTSNTCSSTIAVDGKCAVTITSAPTSTSSGSYTGSFVIASDSSSGSPVTVALTGNVTTSALTLDSTSFSFSAVAGSTAQQTLTLGNNGTGTLNISSYAVSGTNASLFSVSATTCGSTIAVKESCTMTLTFAPVDAGTYTATLTINSDSSTGSATTVSLSGTATGTPDLTFSPTTLNFDTDTGASTTAGKTNTDTLTIINTGTDTATLSAFSISGTNAAFFTETTTCGTTLAVGSSCTVTVTFSPLVKGTYAATLNVPNNTNDGQTVSISATAVGSGITIDTTTATDWVITNGPMVIHYNSTKPRIFSLLLNGEQLVNQSITDSSGPKGFYMDNAFTNSAATAVTCSSYTSDYAEGDETSSNPAYLDWWSTCASSTTFPFTYTMHWVVAANDPGVHVYFVANHATTDITGYIGLVQWVFRDNTTDFTNIYEYNPSVNTPGVTTVQLPTYSEAMFYESTSLAVHYGQYIFDATSDLTTSTDISTDVVDVNGNSTTYANEYSNFYTKYDHAGYEYLHDGHGAYGSNYGIWAVIPSHESMVAGPTKQNLFFTDNMVMMEAYSNHLDLGITYGTASGSSSSRLYGPFYYRFNALGTAYTTTGETLASADDLYNDAITVGKSFSSFYDNEATLVSAGYIKSGTRGSVTVNVSGVVGNGSTTTKAAWAVLSDNQTNFQYSAKGAQYWADITSTGSATFSNVIPGTYRLSVFELGQFGELRVDNVVIAEGANSPLNVTFVPENFRSAGTNAGGELVFNIGTPDRSSHEFLHGHDSNEYDLKQYYGANNYWSDFQANNGSVVFYATAVNGTAASDAGTQWNYNHWNTFNPYLYNSTTPTGSSNNYVNEIPSYVATLSATSATGSAITVSGTNGVTTPVPAWKIHFATPSDFANYSYAIVSVALACDSGSYVMEMNGSSTYARTWAYSASNYTDCSVRSALSGYYQWVAFQFPIAALTQTAGADNVLAISVSAGKGYGDMEDAIRLELTANPADHTTTGWYDYEYVGTSSSSADVTAVDTTSNP